MAELRSLGVHKPAALPYLIAEGILPPDAPETSYTWETAPQDSSPLSHGGNEDEELLITQSCVAWSRGGVVQRLFNLKIEGETVVQAVFARFSSNLEKTSRGATSGNFLPKPGTRGSESAHSAKIHAFSAKPGSRNISSQDRNDRLPGSVDSERALVVVLKTQAHVFFLRGTSYIVHLPFEVSAAFPLPHGVLLQQKIAEHFPRLPTPTLPAAPLNSFAFSNLGSSWSAPNSQSLHNLIDTKHHFGSSQAFDSSFKQILAMSTQNVETNLPRLLCLTDPLSEMGLIVERLVSGSGHYQRNTLLPTVILSPDEEMLYISSSDELEGDAWRGSNPPALILALTYNCETRSNILWVVSYIQPHKRSPLKREKSSASEEYSRRRSSFGPGIGTGATTPAVRQSVGPSESYLTAEDAGRDGEYSRQTEESLASQLDPAFENPGNPAKSSRRVSSLLARSDLSTHRDRNTFPDLNISHSTVAGVRRGASTHNPAIRSSFGKPFEHVTNYRRSTPGSQYGYDVGPNLSDAPKLIDGEDGSNESFDAGTKFTLPNNLAGMRKEMIFTKIHSFPSNAEEGSQKLNMSHNSRRSRVFTLKRPGPEADQPVGNLVMCILDKPSRRISTLLLSVSLSQPRKSKTRFSEDCQRVYQVSVSDMRKGDGVISACKVSEGANSRILFLNETPDGSGELLLQTPWNTAYKITLPSELLIHNPYQIDQHEKVLRKREGGLKRVISGGASSLVDIEHNAGASRVDIKDDKGIRHRIELQMQPADQLVRDLLRVCEYILPCDSTELEPFTRAWWDVFLWLRIRSPETLNREWTAFVVLLFSMCAVLMRDRETPATLRQKKRKGALLRSSSGASVDMDNWNTMMSQEADFGGLPPSWLRSAAWAWTQSSEDVIASNQTSQSSRKATARLSNSQERFHKVVTCKSAFLVDCLALAREFTKSQAGSQVFGESGYLPTARSKTADLRHAALPTLLLGLHLFREELKLNLLAALELDALAPILAQMGGWLNWQSWGWRGDAYYVLEKEDLDNWVFDEGVILNHHQPREIMEPPSVMKHVEDAALAQKPTQFPTLFDISFQSSSSDDARRAKISHLKHLTPRTMMVIDLLNVGHRTASHHLAVMVASGLSISMLDSFPEGIAASLRASIATCQTDPATTWPTDILSMIDRDDILLLEQPDEIRRKPLKSMISPTHEAFRDFHTICSSTFDTEAIGTYDGAAEADRHSVTRMIFKDDQRFTEASKLLHPLKHPIVRCAPEPDWSDTDLLEAQQELVKVIAVRTLSVSPGRGMLFYNARFPLLTERFPIHGFSLACVMKPSNTTVTADRGAFSEEKVSWSFFHAGVEAGLSISREAKGIDTSWILFNKPTELQNRHAGFLLALGLNGHLRSIAKWVAFKYLTPKHTMTSIGLLLGLAASYLGTMDTLITRLLSVHVTRMLPPGAAELNLSPLTQTTGIMAIGLLYCNTQHRRMSEIMLSEMENIDQDDNISPMENLRDEGYRLAAGFALGYINLGKGTNLKGLHDMRIVERLLALAVGTRRVDIVHILDKATAGAVIAVALIFMKTEDEALARKIDIPDTTHQFDYVRPDIFLLRTVARHLIMWNEISPTYAWMYRQLPMVYQPQFKLNSFRVLKTEDMPLLNIVAGLCFTLGLRFAGTARQDVRNLLGHYLDQFIRICRLPALNYDGKLTRITIRNCQDVVALAAASVMAGTGDLYILRRLRLLHGRSDPDTPYGSHLATHLAIGVLFLAGGTHSFNTSNIALASLLCAFYPLFPTAILDNKSHLQAFRHFWVLSAEPRCLTVRNADTHRPISMQVVVTLRSGIAMSATAPCLLPELESIANISTDDPKYWRVTLDFAENPAHLPAFKHHQSIYVRHRGPYDSHCSVFSATMQALNDVQMAQRANKQVFEWIFDLPSFRGFDRAERTLVLPVEGAMVLYNRTRSTVVDDRLMLEKACLNSGRAEKLWNLRILFAWAVMMKRRGEKLNWLGDERVGRLRAAVWLMGREMDESL
ncbi:Anaphase-promoting complex subunit 1 [Xylographa carneopallida]|nr:Anaphase-promoting complex subunit 1 [Xylographa carneopallida]